MKTKLQATIEHLKACRAYRTAGGMASFLNDPAWLIEQAINRRAGWPDDPSHSRGSCMPVNGRHPKKASGDWFRHLRLIASEINTPRLIMRPARLGEHRWLLARLPNRFEI